MYVDLKKNMALKVKILNDFRVSDENMMIPIKVVEDDVITPL